MRKAGCKLLFVWNPEDPEDPVEQLFLRPNELPGGGIKIVSNWRDNFFISDESLEEILHLQRTNPKRFAHIYEGKYRSRETAVFSRWKAEEINPLAYQWPSIPRYRFGADWGFGQDPCVLIRSWRADWAASQGGERYLHATRKGRVLVIDRECYERGLTIAELPSFWGGECDRAAVLNPRQHWDNPRKFNGMPGLWRKETVVADSAGPAFIRHLQDHGFLVRGAVKPEGSILQGVDFINSFDEVVIDPGLPTHGGRIQNLRLESRSKDRAPSFPGGARRQEKPCHRFAAVCVGGRMDEEEPNALNGAARPLAVMSALGFGGIIATHDQTSFRRPAATRQPAPSRCPGVSPSGAQPPVSRRRFPIQTQHRDRRSWRRYGDGAAACR